MGNDRPHFPHTLNVFVFISKKEISKPQKRHAEIISVDYFGLTNFLSNIVLNCNCWSLAAKRCAVSRSRSEASAFDANYNMYIIPQLVVLNSLYGLRASGWFFGYIQRSPTNSCVWFHFVLFIMIKKVFPCLWNQWPNRNRTDMKSGWHGLTMPVKAGNERKLRCDDDQTWQDVSANNTNFHSLALR